MSNNSGLMDTEIGGEQTQYEGEYTDVLPPKKLGGQFGGASSTTPASQSKSSSSDAANTIGITRSEKTRFGQSIQQGGMGGKTEGLGGEATTEGGFGGTKAIHEDVEAPSKARREQGYGGAKDMDRRIGA